MCIAPFNNSQAVLMRHVMFVMFDGGVMIWNLAGSDLTINSSLYQIILKSNVRSFFLTTKAYSKSGHAAGQ